MQLQRLCRNLCVLGVLCVLFFVLFLFFIFFLAADRGHRIRVIVDPCDRHGKVRSDPDHSFRRSDVQMVRGSG